MTRGVNLFQYMKSIKKDSVNQKNYRSGLAGEHIIVSSWNKMIISDLEKMRFLLNKVIKFKKEQKYKTKVKNDNTPTLNTVDNGFTKDN